MPAVSAFIPETITPPDNPPSTLGFIRAMIHNPIELWSKPLFEEPYRLQHWGGRTIIQIADPELAKTVLLDEAEAFQKTPLALRILKPLMGEGILTSEGARWRAQRRSAAPAFRPSALLALVPTMVHAGEVTADRILRALQANQPLDVVPEMTHATLDVIAETLMGASDDAASDPNFSYERVAGIIDDYLTSVGAVDLFDLFGVPHWVPRPWSAHGRRAAQELREGAARAIARRRASGTDGDDLLGLLIAARDPETGAGLSDSELCDNVATFIAAGHETTALALTWTLYLVANDQAVQDRLAEEAFRICGTGEITAEQVERMTYHLMVVREAMRLYPPVAATEREAHQVVQIGPVTLRPGDRAVVPFYVMHRHKRLWTAPETFDPERFSPEQSAGRHRYAYLPFSAGPRICIGAKFAELESVSILAALVRRLRFKPNPAHRILPKMRITTRPEGGMPLYIEAR